MTTTSKDIGGTTPEMKQEPTPETTKPTEGFLVKFENNSKHTQQIWFPDRQAIRLPANQFFETKIADAENIYSRYSNIEYLDEEVKLTIRDGWSEPSRPFPTVIFFNEAGVNLETLTFQDCKVSMPRGIPVHKEWSIFSAISAYQNYSIRLVDCIAPEYQDVRTQKTTEHVKGESIMNGYSDQVEYERPIEKKIVTVHPATTFQKPNIVLENLRSPDELELLKLMKEDSLAAEKEYRLRQ